MKSLPKISVVTVCRNALQMLSKTVDSVCAQTYPNVEYIIIDGASTDGTSEYLVSHAECFARVISEPDGGIFDAMNKGIRAATGDWVIFMNAGDTFVSSATLSEVFDRGDDYSGYGVVYGDEIRPGRDGQPRVDVAEEPANRHRMYFCHQSAFVRRELLEQVPFDLKHRLSGDFCQVKMLHRRGVKFKHVNIPIAVYDTGGVSSANRSKVLRDHLSVVLEHDRFVDCVRFVPRLLIPYLVCRMRGK